MVKISKRRRIIKFFEDKELPLEFEQEEMYQWMNRNKNAQVTPNCIPEEAIPALFSFMLFLSWIGAFVAILVIYNIHYIL